MDISPSPMAETRRSLLPSVRCSIESLSLCVGGRGHETLILALEQPRQLYAGAITILGADDLDTHGQPRSGLAGRRYRSRKIRHPRVARPEQLVGGGDGSTVDVDGALVTLARVIVRKG